MCEGGTGLVIAAALLEAHGTDQGPHGKEVFGGPAAHGEAVPGGQKSS